MKSTNNVNHNNMAYFALRTNRTAESVLKSEVNTVTYT